MIRIFSGALGLACLFGMLSAATPASAEAVRWRASGSFPASHSSAVAMEVFKSEVARLSDNTITIDVFPDNMLGGAFEQVDQVRTGQIEMAWAGLSFYDKLVPEFSAAVRPFAAVSTSEAICQIESPFGDILRAKASEKGVVVAGFGMIGARHVTNSVRPIKTLEDIRGLKIRIPPADAWTLLFSALGANPTPLDIKELYQALQQRVVDGQENPYDNIHIRKFQEVQKYLSNTAHFYDLVGYFINKDAYERLDEKQKKAVADAMFNAIAVQRALSDRDNSKARQALIDAGMQYDELPASELARFREAARPFYEGLRATVGNEVMDLADKAAESCK
ncbi:MAG: TRAP transporter substrate-binding protein [Parvibaculaceae bacterium]